MKKNVAHVSKKQNINTSSKTDVQKAMYKQCNFRLDLQPDTDLHTTAKSRLAGQINSKLRLQYRVSDKTGGAFVQECLKSRCDLAADTDKEKAMAQFKPAAKCLPGKGCTRPVSVVQAMKAAQSAWRHRVMWSNPISMDLDLSARV